MGYNRSNLIRLREEYEAKRHRAVSLAAQRREQLHAESAALAEIDTLLSQTGLKLFAIACKGDKEALDDLINQVRAENEALLSKRAALLEELGLPADYTEVQYECRRCNDSGYLPDTRMCPCFKQALTLAGFRSSGLGDLIDKQSFDNFSLDYYRQNKDELQRMTQNLEQAKTYAQDFHAGSGNLLFMGGTGLGKTHLSTAIARTVIGRGYDVLYESAQNIFNDFEYDRFKSSYRDREDEPRGAKYLECDLLIMDDLGAEMSTQFTTSCLYHILNTRINQGRATLVSTNLLQHELLTRYGERITSRFIGEYHILQFCGADVRLQK